MITRIALLWILFTCTYSYLGWRRRRSSCDPQGGGWASWGSWAACTCTDNIATKTRNRTCANPIAWCGGRTCYGAANQTVSCYDLKVDGQWSEWGPWSNECECLQDEESRSRSRTCDSPAPTCGGATCGGSSSEIDNCAVDGGWSEWGTWGECDCQHSTGTGNKSKNRYCMNPEPSCRGLTCEGRSVEEGYCDDQCCKSVDGGWEEWVEWSVCDCDHMTGSGVRERKRVCTNPPPSCDGKECDDAGGLEEEKCLEQCCKLVDGSWTEWNEWGDCECNHSTGTGEERRERECSDPEPECGGAPCEGQQTEERQCSESCCTMVSGGWADWGEWKDCICDYDTGEGTWSRSKSCSNPTPDCGGAECEGDGTEVDTCSDQCCSSQDGQWTGWLNWSVCDCDSSAGTGIWSKQRDCTNPEPSCHGDTCPGDFTVRATCSQHCCKTMDGGWTDWSEWGLCECVYKKGTFERTRTCSNPAPFCGGEPCGGEFEVVGICDDQCKYNCDENNTCDEHCMVNCDDNTHSSMSTVIESSCPASQFLVNERCRSKFYIGIFCGVIVLLLLATASVILVFRNCKSKQIAEPVEFQNPTYGDGEFQNPIYDDGDDGALGIPSCLPPDPMTDDCVNWNSCADDFSDNHVNPYVADTPDIEQNPYVREENIISRTSDGLDLADIEPNELTTEYVEFVDDEHIYFDPELCDVI